MKRRAIGLIPLERLDLHNAYNGLEVVLLTLGVNYESEMLFLETKE